MWALIVAIAFTLSVSAFCSLLEAMILSTTTAEIEALKNRKARLGELLEKFKAEIEETSSAILSLNTVANTLGATATGVIAAIHFGSDSGIARYAIPLGMTVGILLLSEVLPKNIGVIYRPSLQPYMVYPLHVVRMVMLPVSWICGRIVSYVTRRRNVLESGDEEIILLAEKSAKDGTLTQRESTMISNALSLDEARVYEIMTPRTVVTAFDCEQTVGDALEKYPNIPFARMPVYEESIDHILGVVRRRDILKEKAENRNSTTMRELCQKSVFIPDNASCAHALQILIKNRQQLAAVVDEFGSTAGVITMEDIVEYILGQEIFEDDDVAVDMRDLAKRKLIAKTRQKPETSATDLGATKVRQPTTGASH